ncbi:MAG: EamA family transporter [Clostridia bacterium]|nr:EamA family transporter [Clostridia bacterium]
MAYLFVLLSLLCGNIKGLCGKKTSCYVQRTDDAMVFSTIRIAMCVVIGFFMMIAENPSWQNIKIDGGMLAICIFAGISNAVFILCWMLAIRKTAMVTLDVALTVGSLIPAVLCAVFFNEAVSPQKMIGFAFILAAVWVLSSYNKSTMGKTGLGAVILVILSAAGEGLSSFSQQLFKHFYTPVGVCFTGIEYTKTVYHFYTYVFMGATLLISLCIFLMCNRNGKTASFLQGGIKNLMRPLFYITVMAACLFGASYFQTVAANDYGMPSQILYPVLKGGSLIITSIVAMIFFGEKITVRSIVGIILAIIGTVSMNLL